MHNGGDMHPVTEGDSLSLRRRRCALTILFLIYALNFLDRQIVNILAEQIKQNLHLTDWQLGSLTGLSFALFYATLALPIARLAERGDRVKVISISAIVWSAFTMLCGMAQSFAQLFLARVGVGVGEAGCTPAAHSLISDYVPKERRASAMALFSLGIPVGSLLGMALGGMIADAFGWRAAFLVVGLPGVILGVTALLILPEPRRTALGEVAIPAPYGFREALKELRTSPAFIWTTIAMVLMCFANYGQLAFQSSFFLRNHEEGLNILAEALHALFGVRLGPTGLLGTVLGLTVGISGGLGTWLGGAIADKAARKDIRAYATIPALASLLLPVALAMAYLAPSIISAFGFLCIAMLLQSLFYGPIFATVQSLAQPRNRATAAAIFLFFGNLFGLGLGPLAVGTLSDMIAVHLGVNAGIRWSLIAIGFAYFAACGAFLMARRTIRDDIIS